MAGWLQAALKAVIPHVGDILSATKPAFTQRKSEAAANPPDLVQQAEVAVRLTEPVVEMLILIRWEDSPVRYPKETGVTRLEC